MSDQAPGSGEPNFGTGGFLPYVPHGVAALFFLVYNLSRYGDNGDRWPGFMSFLFVFSICSALLTHDVLYVLGLKRIDLFWTQHLEDSHPDPETKFVPTWPSPFASGLWTLAGLLAPLVVFPLLPQSVKSALAPMSGLILGALLPVSAFVAFELSPLARFARQRGRVGDKFIELSERITRRSAKAFEARFALEGTSRIKEAAYWWSTAGMALNSENPEEAVRTLEDHARVYGADLINRKAQILSAYRSSTDICATPAKATFLADWAVENRIDALDDLPQGDRTVERLSLILRAHHEREMRVLVIAEPAFFARAVATAPPLRPETFEEHCRRLLREADEIFDVRARLKKELESKAEKLAPEERESYVRSRFELIDQMTVEEITDRLQRAK